MHMNIFIITCAPVGKFILFFVKPPKYEISHQNILEKFDLGDLPLGNFKFVKETIRKHNG